mmetsp:Transcript_103549/g.200631  ORF Transcript_103549/g.200631 Transcript_103549/m.200631 type:complete len:80 (+) Transcript_103549:214-453(+)
MLRQAHSPAQFHYAAGKYFVPFLVNMAEPSKADLAGFPTSPFQKRQTRDSLWCWASDNEMGQGCGDRNGYSATIVVEVC